MIRFGTVSIVDHNKGTVKVVYDDLEITSAELNVFQGRNKGTLEYSMPEVGERGLCLLTTHGNNGYYLGSGFDERAVIPAGAGKGKFITIYPDGTKVIFDVNSSKMFVDCKKDIEIICPQITITGNIKITGDIELIGKMESTGDMIAGGISTINHVHGGVKGGSDKTKKPS